MPITMNAAAWKLISPSEANACMIAILAEELWITAVKIVPAKTASTGLSKLTKKLVSAALRCV